MTAPTLTGTEKQVAYATTTRAEWLVQMERMVADLRTPIAPEVKFSPRLNGVRVSHAAKLAFERALGLIYSTTGPLRRTSTDAQADLAAHAAARDALATRFATVTPEQLADAIEASIADITARRTEAGWWLDTRGDLVPTYLNIVARFSAQ